MDDQREPVPILLSLKASQDLSRKQLLSEFEQAGVDLPVVCLETVLDREISATDYDASHSRKNIVSPNFRSFSSRADATFVRDESAKTSHSNNEMSFGNLYMEPVRSKSTSRADVSNDDHRGNSMFSMKILGVVSPAVSDTDKSSPNSETARSLDDSLRSGKAEGTTVGGIDPQDPNSSNAENVSSSDAEPESATLAETVEGTLGVAMGFPCSNYCCPHKNDGATDKKYVVSSLQHEQGLDDEGTSHSSRHTTRDMLSGVGSLLDLDDAMTNASSIENHPNDVPSKEKRVKATFKGGHRRFRMAMVACCIIHIVLVGLIIGFAIRGEDDSESQIAANTGTSTNNDGALSSGNDGATQTVDGMITTTTCIDSLELSLTCYGQESEVLVYFNSCIPQSGDWVAIYESSEDATKLLKEDSVDWLFTCGDQVCSEVVSSEVVALSNGNLTPGGTYRVHLIPDGPGPTYEAYASSVEFEVMESLADCDAM